MLFLESITIEIDILNVMTHFVSTKTYGCDIFKFYNRFQMFSFSNRTIVPYLYADRCKKTIVVEHRKREERECEKKRTQKLLCTICGYNIALLLFCYNERSVQYFTHSIKY